MSADSINLLHHRIRSDINTLARERDDATGVRIFGAAADHANAELARERARKIAAQQMAEQGIVIVRGDNTPAVIIRGFDVKP